MGGLSSSAYTGDKSESSEMKRCCDIAIGNSYDLALAVNNLEVKLSTSSKQLRSEIHVLIGTTTSCVLSCCHSHVEVDNFIYVVRNLAPMMYIS